MSLVKWVFTVSKMAQLCIEFVWSNLIEVKEVCFWNTEDYLHQVLSSVLLTHIYLISLEKNSLYSQWSNVEANFSFLSDISSLQLAFGVKCPVWEDQTWNTELMMFGTEAALLSLGYGSVSYGVLIR